MPSTAFRPGWKAAVSAASGTILGVLAALPAWGADEAANFPTRPIRIVVPFQPGGLPDLATRLIGPKLLEVWKQPVVVDNRTGAGGVIGTDVVAKSNTDGYTLVMASAGHPAAPAIYANLPYDTLKDFAGITLTVVGAVALVVPPSLGAKSVKELIALAMARPGQLNFASAGAGSGTHFAAELFKDLAKIDVVHVAYRGIPDGLTDTIAGRVQFFMPSFASAAPLVKDGKLLALAVSRRVPGYESIPTFSETGLQGYNWDGWAGLLAPAKTPRAIINRLNREVTRALNLPDVKQRILALGLDVVPTTPAEFDKLIADQVEISARLARKAGIKPQ